MRSVSIVCIVCLALGAVACSKRAHEPPDAGTQSGIAGSVGVGSPFGNATAASDAGVTSGGPRRDAGALDIGDCGHLDVTNLDLLFMVDDSNSMVEEQAALRQQFPALITRLTSGDLDGDGTSDAPPIAELHLGVVSSDMGLVGVSHIDRCAFQGRDGVLQNAPSPQVPGCFGPYPRFLTFEGATGDSAQTATDFACIATLGTSGCGFEQQLEATLKALWPSLDRSITFLASVDSPVGAEMLGHGDTDNLGFLRPGTGPNASMLAIVVVTDEDDCSASMTNIFRPVRDLDASVADEAVLLAQSLNTRCHFHPDALYPVSRYVDGFKALRAGSEGLLMFAAIVGVPPELVDHDALAKVDFADSAQREHFYDALLAAPEMQERIDDKATFDGADDGIFPSCSTATGRAYPPRRIVETARGLGRDAIVQSICQSDFGPAMNAIMAAIYRASKAACVVD